MIIIPDSGKLQANKHGFLPLLSTLSPASTTAIIVLGLKSYSLSSLGQLCEDGCNLLLHKNNMYSIKDKEVLIEG